MAAGPTAFFDRTYDDALGLLMQARSYASTRQRTEVDVLPPMVRLEATLEAMRTTAMLGHAIAWLLVRRAVRAGELTAEQALAPEHRLGGRRPSFASDPEALPTELRRIVDASSRLYDRVARLEELTLRQAA